MLLWTQQGLRMRGRCGVACICLKFLGWQGQDSSQAQLTWLCFLTEQDVCCNTRLSHGCSGLHPGKSRPSGIAIIPALGGLQLGNMVAGK